MGASDPEEINRFYYGPKCKKGHDGLRYIKGRTCVYCAKEGLERAKENRAINSAKAFGFRGHIKEWPSHWRFEDDPKAIKREARYRG